MSARRDWTIAEARAWLEASLPEGWDVGIDIDATPASNRPHVRVWAAYAREGAEAFCDARVPNHPTLRAACRALVRSAKRAGINVNAATEPQGGGK